MKKIFLSLAETEGGEEALSVGVTWEAPTGDQGHLCVACEGNVVGEVFFVKENSKMKTKKTQFVNFSCKESVYGWVDHSDEY